MTPGCYRAAFEPRTATPAKPAWPLWSAPPSRRFRRPRRQSRHGLFGRRRLVGALVAEERGNLEHVRWDLERLFALFAPSRRDRLLGDGSPTAAMRTRPKPGRDHRHSHLVLERLVDHGAENHVRVPVCRARHDLRRLVDLEEAQV